MGAKPYVISEHIGKKYGEFTVLGAAVNKPRGGRVLCRCSCGKESERGLSPIVLGTTTSCGCKQYADMRVANTVHGLSGGRRGRSDRFYTIYYNLRRRTLKQGKREQCYSGVKNLWDNFVEFKNDMYESYLEHIKEHGEKQTTIDRIDSSGDYCKTNCKWSTIEEQSLNKVITLRIEYNGASITIKELAKKIGVGYSTLRYRYQKYLLGMFTYDQLVYPGNLDRYEEPLRV